jgi:hypothetical protein
LLVFSVWYVVPFCWALVTSVKHPGMVFDGRWLPYARAQPAVFEGRRREIRMVEEHGDSLRVLLHQSTAIQSLRAMQAEINGEIQAKRRVPEGRPFRGSILSRVCAALCAGMCVLAWRLLRKSRAANAGA